MPERSHKDPILLASDNMLQRRLEIKAQLSKVNMPYKPKYENVSLSLERFLMWDLKIDQMCSFRGPLIWHLMFIWSVHTWGKWCEMLHFSGGPGCQHGPHRNANQVSEKGRKSETDDEFLLFICVRAVYSDIAYVKYTIYIHWSRCDHLVWPMSQTIDIDPLHNIKLGITKNRQRRTI